MAKFSKIKSLKIIFILAVFTLLINVSSTETTTAIITTDATANDVTSTIYSLDPRNDTSSTDTTDGTAYMTIKDFTSDTTHNEMSAINSTFVTISDTTLDITTKDSTTDNDKKATSDIINDVISSFIYSSNTMETTRVKGNNTTEAIETDLITEISRI